ATRRQNAGGEAYRRPERAQCRQNAAEQGAAVYAGARKVSRGFVLSADWRAEQGERIAKESGGAQLIPAEQERLSRRGLGPGVPVKPYLPAVCETQRYVERYLINVQYAGIAVEVVPKHCKVELALAKSAGRKCVEQPRAAKTCWRFLPLGEIASSVLLGERSSRQDKEHRDQRADLSSRLHLFAS